MTPRKVFVIWRPWLSPFIHALSRCLVEAGAEVHLYVRRAGDIAVMKKTAPEGLYARVTPFQILYDLACAPAQAEEFEIARAKAHEDWLGTTYGQLAVADRHLGRGFAVGGPNFPTSAQSRSSYAQMLAAFSGQIEFWKREIEVHQPDLVIEADPIVDRIARKMNIPTRITAAARHENYYYWAENYFLETSALLPAWEKARREPVQELPVVQPATAIVTYWQTAMAATTLRYFIKASFEQVGRRVYHKLRGRNLGPTYDLWPTLVYLWRSRKQMKQMTGREMRKLSDLGEAPIVFFPLATEPEVTLQGLSPEYFFQLEAIASIARDLPAGVLLAVKEHHPACGARADDFYDQILAFKNVVMLDMRERGVDVVRRAAVTVTIAGSAGFEAAVMGKPVIVFGRHNSYVFLPHVKCVTDKTQLRAVLADALSGRLAKADSVQNGARLLRAVEAISFDLGKYDPFIVGSEVNETAARAGHARLLESLAQNAPATRAAVN